MIARLMGIMGRIGLRVGSLLEPGRGFMGRVDFMDM